MQPSQEHWLDLAIDGEGDASIRISLRSSQQVSVKPYVANGIERGALKRFALEVRLAAQSGKGVTGPLLETAQKLHKNLVAGFGDSLRARMRRTDQPPLLLRVFASDSELQGVPWEALAFPEESLGFWANAPAFVTGRGVFTDDLWLGPREVLGALRILLVAPQGNALTARTRTAIAASEKLGHLEWLTPLEDERAQSLAARLQTEPLPHVIHFVGHGRLSEEGRSEILLGREEDENGWYPAELLAQEIQRTKGSVRLVVLEACEGARPSPFSSAAEILAREGVSAVVAHLWEVGAEAARKCSEAFYRSLTSVSRDGGDVGVALSNARRAMLPHAEAFSPVLYLRHPSMRLFDFRSRKIKPKATPAKEKTDTVGPTAVAVPEDLGRLLNEGRFSLLIGDLGAGERDALDTLRGRLVSQVDRVPEGLPFSALAQRYAVAKGLEQLSTEFQDVFNEILPERVVKERAPLLIELACRVGPGVHTTLLRCPHFEFAVATHHPDRSIYVLQPSDQGVMAFHRASGAADWVRLGQPPKAVDTAHEIVILRLYRGYLPRQLFTKPMLTEDDYLFGFSELEAGVSEDLAYSIRRTLKEQPSLLVGLSALQWNHRVLIQKLYREGLPPRSIAVVERGRDDQAGLDRKVWESGVCMPANRGIIVVEAPHDALAHSLEALRIGEA